jgi:hypothetical protein
MGKVKISDVISDLLSETDKSIHDYDRLETLALSVLRLLNLDVLGNIKTKMLKVESNKKVYFPKDYVNYIKVGIVNHEGEIATFTRNKDLALNQNAPSAGSPDNSYQHYSDFNLVGYTRNVYYGKGSEVNIGGFRVDEADGSMVFDPGFSHSEIVLEYLSSEIDVDGEYFVDDRLEEALKAGAYFFSIRRLKTTSRMDKRDAESDWNKAKRQAKSRVNPFRLFEAGDVVRKSVRLSIKA